MSEPGRWSSVRWPTTAWWPDRSCGGRYPSCRRRSGSRQPRPCRSRRPPRSGFQRSNSPSVTGIGADHCSAIEVHQSDLVAVAVGNERTEIARLGGLHVGLPPRLVGDKGDPHCAVRPPGRRRIIVIAVGSSQARRRGQTPHCQRSIKTRKRLVESDLIEWDGDLSRVRIEFQHGTGLGLQRYEHCGGIFRRAARPRPAA